MLNKGVWETLDIIVKIVATIIGLYFTVVYQCSQRELNEVQKEAIKAQLEATKAQLQSNILTLIGGNEMQRNLAIKLTSAFADKFNDDQFPKIVTQNSSTNDESLQVREEAKKVFAEQIIKSADNFCKFGGSDNYDQGVKQYKEAIRLIPPDRLNQQLLKEAGEELDSEKACNLYRKLFSPLR